MNGLFAMMTLAAMGIFLLVTIVSLVEKMNRKHLSHGWVSALWWSAFMMFAAHLYAVLVTVVQLS